MNSLQGQAYGTNTIWGQYIDENKHAFSEEHEFGNS